VVARQKTCRGRLSDIKELKQRVRDRIAPDKPLGHSDKPAGERDCNLVGRR